MKLLVLGSTGMVGSNLMDCLQEDSIESLEILSPSSSELNLLEHKNVEKYFQNNRPDIVVNCAGLVGGIQKNIRNQASFLYQNTLIGLNLGDVSKNSGVSKFINLSSSCVYPKNLGHLKEENILSGPLEPTNEGYAIAKLAVQKYLDFLSDDSFDVVTLMPCNLYGRYDDFSEEGSHLVSAIIRKVHDYLEGKTDFIEIWGDGKARREFMYGKDLSYFIKKLIIDDLTLPKIMNVGVGEDKSILEYYEAVCNVLGADHNFRFDLSRPVGMQQKLLDVSEQKKLSWMPPTSLEQGVKKTYEYYLLSL
jgi:GDP-L-fucose synthase